MTIGLRVTDVRQALDFYDGIGFKQVMVVPDEQGNPVFCSMRYGSGFLVFDAVETEMPMPETQRERDMKKGPRGLGVKIGLEVPDIEPVYRHFKKSRLRNYL